MCGAPVQGGTVDPAVVGDATVVEGVVVRAGAPVPGAYVRLLDADGEFTAEVVTSATGRFRFYAAPGEWTLRALAPGRVGELRLAAGPGLTTTEMALPA